MNSISMATKRSVTLSIGVLIMSGFALAGCTSVEVKPIADVQSIKEVYVVENPDVSVDDFVSVLSSGFENHGIGVRVIQEKDTPAKGYVVTYTASRKWDLKPYMCDASIQIAHDGLRVAHADYHLNGGGGFDLGKFAGTKSKLYPIIDQLLSASSPEQHP